MFADTDMKAGDRIPGLVNNIVFNFGDRTEKLTITPVVDLAGSDQGEAAFGLPQPPAARGGL